MTMPYRVEAWDDADGRWRPVGPVFTERDEAERFLRTNAPVYARLVSVAWDEDNHACLDQATVARLRFARWLRETGRLGEGAEQERRDAPR